MSYRSLEGLRSVKIYEGSLVIKYLSLNAVSCFCHCSLVPKLDFHVLFV